MKGFFTTEMSDLFWFCKPRGDNKFQITEFYKYGKLKGMVISKNVYEIPPKNRQHWIKYNRS